MNVLHVLGGTTAPAASSSRFGSFGIGPGYSVTENMQIDARSSGTVSLLGGYVSAYDRAAGEVRLRKNAADGNSVAAVSAAGQVEDTTGTDAVAAADSLVKEWTVGSGGTVSTMESIWHLWTPGAGTVCYITRGGSTLSGTGDRYPHLASNNGTPGTTQADGQSIALASATLQNLFSNAAANTRDDACDIRVQVNGANGNGVNSWAAGATGEREDTTGTDAVVSGDEVGYIWDQNGGTGTLTHRSSKIELSGTNTYQWMACNQGGTTQANALTRYIGVGGEISATIDDIEADRQVKVPDTSTWSKLAAYVSSLSLGGGGTLTIRARKNAGDGNQTVAFSGTGQQFDTTNTDALTAGDDVCWSMVTTGSSGSTIYRTVSSLVSGGTVAPPVRMLNQGHRPAMFKPGVRR